MTFFCARSRSVPGLVGNDPLEVAVLHLHEHVARRRLAAGEVDRAEHPVGVELVDLVQLLRRSSCG